MKHKFIILLSTMLIVSTFVGCRSQTKNEDLSQKAPASVNSEPLNEEEQNGNASNNNSLNGTEALNPANGDELFEVSKLSGTVTEFSENSCTITPTVCEGDVAYGAAQGYEEQQEEITVTYDEVATFQIAYVNIQTGEVAYDIASRSDVKKQTYLVICGEYDSDNALHASRVFIYRNME